MSSGRPLDLVLLLTSQDHAGRVAALAPLLLREQLQFSGVAEIVPNRVRFSAVRIPPAAAIACLHAAAPAVMARVCGLFWLPCREDGGAAAATLTLAELCAAPPLPPPQATAFRVLTPATKTLAGPLLAALEAKSPVPASRTAFSHCLFADFNDNGSSVEWLWLPRDCVWVPPSDSAPLHGSSVATAVRKLDEALSVVSAAQFIGEGLQLRRAVDVGASPGAWTARLAAVCDTVVVAVDPADLAPAVAALPNVRHVRRTAKDAVADVRKELGDGVDAAADILTCDANVHPAEMVGWVKELLPLLRPGGLLVLTLKFRGTGRDRTAAVANIDAQLSELVQTPGTCLWLMSNTGHERTYIAVRK